MEEDGREDSKRRTRNLSEKKRRDQFNMLVNELSAMVSTSNKKMDKSTVLKSTISFLRNHNEVRVRSRVHDIQDDWKPSFLSNEEFTYLVLEALEGFIMVFSATGRICYVSESITTILGPSPADVVNKTIFDLAYEEDRPHLYALLQNPSAPLDSSQSVLLEDNEIRFQCHLRRGTLDFREEPSYELVQFNGYCRTNDHLGRDEMGYYQDQDSSLLFICTGRLSTSQLIRDVSLVTNRKEFTSRHSLEWKFLFLDHRAPPIIGYLPFEVLGTSGYDYYHFDDLEKIIACHDALIQKGVFTSCYYRFLTKGQQWIWLQSRFYITYHQWNSKPEFVVCNHRVVSYADMNRGLKQEEPESMRGADSSALQIDVRDSAEGHMAAMSPGRAAVSENSEMYSFQDMSHTPSMASVSGASTAGTAQPAGRRAPPSPRRLPPTPHENHAEEAAIVCQHGVGTAYLEPEPFLAASVVLPLTTLPVIVAQDPSQLEEQLQRKHELLQQMIVRQQEELRHVKEQLLLARLGILPPLAPDEYMSNASITEVQQEPPSRSSSPSHQQNMQH